MFTKSLPFFLIVETPLHAGSGSELGIVDLPIQRERHTGFPKIESSGLKGCIREAFENLKEVKINANTSIKDLYLTKAIQIVFGPEEGEAHSGSLGFTDARLLLFPVKSMKGVFGWISCPQILQKFQHEVSLTGIDIIPSIPGENTVPENCSLLIAGNKIVLEEYTFEVKPSDTRNKVCTNFAIWLADKIFPINQKENIAEKPDVYRFWNNKLARDLVILPDDDFRHFVTFSTEIIARTKIKNETGTVQSGALFYEEYLPQESILYSLALAGKIFVAEEKDKEIFSQPSKDEADLLLEFFEKGLQPVIQLGGNATTGKGIVRTQLF